MKKLLGIFALMALGAAPAMAQNPVDRFELGVGGTFRLFQQTETSDSSKIGMPGWYFDGVYNIHRFKGLFGIQVEGTGAYRHQGTFGNTSIYAIQAGPRIYLFGHHKLTPYGEILFGDGYYRNNIPAYGGYQSSVYSYTAFTYSGGAGLELNIRHSLTVRMIQFDVGQTSFFNYNTKQTNYRASIGVSYHFSRIHF
jgi:outer membrane protein with beta-barrel domain